MEDLTIIKSLIRCTEVQAQILHILALNTTEEKERQEINKNSLCDETDCDSATIEKNIFALPHVKMDGLIYPLISSLAESNDKYIWKWNENVMTYIAVISSVPYLLFTAKSSYTVDFYELLSEYISGIKNPLTSATLDIELVDLKRRMGCENKYSNFSQFKTKVLEKAIPELSNILHVNIDYSFIKNGKEIIKIRFFIGGSAPIQIR